MSIRMLGRGLGWALLGGLLGLNLLLGSRLYSDEVRHSPKISAKYAYHCGYDKNW